MARLGPLQSKIRLSGQQLGAVSQEELQALSQAAGRPAPPTSPVETSVIGGTPDQSKMAGTPAQKTAALRLGIEGQASLQDRLRTEQVRGQATESEQEKLDKARGLEQLGGLDSRVDALVNQARANISSANIEVLDSLEASIPEELSPIVQPLSARIRQDPNDMAAVRDLAASLGVSATNISELDAKVKELYSPDQALLQEAQDLDLADDQVISLDLESLGFSSLDELAGLLGVPTEQLAEMTTSGLIDLVQAEQQAEFSAADQLRNKLADPTVGAAERAEARRMLREMGATGVKVAESDIENLAQQIEDASVVSFGGEEVEVGELLDSDYLSGLAKRYYEEPEFAKSLKESEPEYAKWLDDNKAAVEAATKELDPVVANFAEIQYKNQEMFKEITNILGEEKLEQLIPELAELQTEVMEPDQLGSGVLSIVADKQDPRQDALLNNLPVIASRYPEYLNEFLALSETELSQLGALHSDGKFDQVVSFLDQRRMLDRITPEDETGVYSAIFGPGQNAAALKNKLEMVAKLKAQGFKTDPALDKFFSPTGQLLPTEELYKIAQSTMPAKSLREMTNMSQSPANKLLDAVAAADQMAADSPAFLKASPYLGPGDTQIDSSEFDSFIKEVNLTHTDIEDYYNNWSNLFTAEALIKLKNKYKQDPVVVQGLYDTYEISNKLQELITPLADGSMHGGVPTSVKAVKNADDATNIISNRISHVVDTFTSEAYDKFTGSGTMSTFGGPINLNKLHGAEARRKITYHWNTEVLNNIINPIKAQLNTIINNPGTSALAKELYQSELAKIERTEDIARRQVEEALYWMDRGERPGFIFAGDR